MEKDDKIQELLSVLDMTEDKQWKWIVKRDDIQKLCDNQLDEDCHFRYKRRVLADLAFRKRDEAVKKYGLKYWLLASQRVADKAFIVYKWKWCSQPIHWIIAALIAKVLSEKGE
jgi:hypothetical protein